MRPRILFLGHSAALSGAELFLTGMLARARDLDPVVLLFEDGPLVAHLRSLGVETSVCPMPRTLDSVSQAGWGEADALAVVRRLPGFARRLHRAVRDSGAVALHTNSAKAHVVTAAVARPARLPVAMHVHDRIAVDSYGRANRVALHASAAAARTVLVNSETTRASLRPREHRRAHVVPCPVEVHPLPPGQAGRAVRSGRTDAVSVALVGRVSPWKGQHEAIRAVAAAAAAPTPVRVDLHLYGAPLFERDQEYAREARALAERLGVADRVHEHGHVSDVTTAMRSHDVVLHASTRPEPFGQVLVEAMAAGLPVLAADRGGPSELLAHGTSGWLYRLGDVEAMTRGLLTLAADPALRDRLAAAAHVRAADFSYDRVLPRWERILLATAGATGAAPAPDGR